MQDIKVKSNQRLCKNQRLQIGESFYLQPE
jgi:hypothetical protein